MSEDRIDKAAGMLVGEIAELYGMTVAELVGRLGPAPRAYKNAKCPLGASMVAFMRGRSTPISAAELIRAMGRRGDGQAVYNRLQKLLDQGVVRRVKHGHYELADSVQMLARQAYRSFRRPPYTVPTWDKLTAREQERWASMVRRLGREMVKPARSLKAVG